MKLTVDEVERMLLARVEASNGTSREALWDLAVYYSKVRRQREALGCVARLRTVANSDEEHAACQLAMGQLQEQMGDFEFATQFYRGGLELAVQTADSWYWLNNNLGYSLVQVECPSEAVPFLEAAISANGGRSNAHKNLGLAHERLGAYALAVRSFVAATRANASDARSLGHLEQLVATHPDVLAEVPRLAETLAECRSAVALAAAQQPKASAQQLRLPRDVQ